MTYRIEEDDHYGALQTLKAFMVRAKKRNGKFKGFIIYF